MRPKIILALLAAGFLVILAAVFLNRTSKHSDGFTKTAPSNALTSLAAPKIHASILKAKPSDHSAVIENSEADAQKNLRELDEIFVNGNVDAVALVSAKLSHPDKRVRLTALTNLVELDNRDAIPALQQAADQAVDADEKTNLLKAIEFLQLPSAAEAMSPIPPAKIKTRSEGEATNVHHSPTNTP